MVSSVTFGALTVLNPMFAIPSSMLNLLPILLDYPYVLHYHRHLEKKLNDAIHNSIKQTQAHIEHDEKWGSEDHEQLFKQLFEKNIEITDVKDLISKTEKYRQECSENPQIYEIVGLYNGFFAEEVSKNSDLRRICILCSEMTSLNNLKKIHGMVKETNKKIDTIDEKVSKFSSVIERMNEILTKIINSVIFSFVSMAIFLLIFISVRNYIEINIDFQRNILFFGSSIKLLYCGYIVTKM